MEAQISGEIATIDTRMGNHFLWAVEMTLRLEIYDEISTISTSP